MSGTNSGISVGVKWRNKQVDGDTYYKNDWSYLGIWQGVANKKTTDLLEPQSLGIPFQPFTGTYAAPQNIAKQVITGQRYTFAEGGYLKSYSIEVLAGNHYEVYSVIDPLGTPIINQLLNLTAESTGTFEFNLGNLIVTAGSVFDLVKITNEPDATPTITPLDYSYQKPNNASTPTLGQISHAVKLTDTLRVNKTDNNLTDQSVFLATLTVGDIISLSDVSWSIQAIVDDGSYYSFTVAPATQSVLNGTQSFSFETVTATPITHAQSTDYFLGDTQVRGLFIIDGGYNDIVPDDNAYGVNITVQRVSLSADWDLLYSGSGGSSGGVSSGGGSNSGVFSESTTLTVNDSGQNFVTNSSGTLLANDADSVIDSTKGSAQEGHGNYDVAGSFFDVSKITTPCQISMKAVWTPNNNEEGGIEYRVFSDKTDIPASLITVQTSAYKTSRSGMQNEVTTMFTYNPIDGIKVEALQIYGISRNNETITLNFFSFWVNKLYV